MSSEIDMVVFDMDGVLAHLDRARRLELLVGDDRQGAGVPLGCDLGLDVERSAELGAFPIGAPSISRSSIAGRRAT
jgi:hypothetical protein